MENILTGRRGEFDRIYAAIFGLVEVVRIYLEAAPT